MGKYYLTLSKMFEKILSMRGQGREVLGLKINH